MGLSTAALKLLVLALAQVCCARLGANKNNKGIYPIKQRKLETTIITEGELDEFMLTFSFDSPPKALDRFLVEIKTTDGDLPISSLGIVEVAMNQFVKNILQGQFQQLDEVKMVETTITNQNSLENLDGSTLEFEIITTFRNEPSPRKESVDRKLEERMTDQNMLDFVDILRGLASLEKDEELLNVTEAIRKLYPDETPEGITKAGSGDDAVLEGKVRIVVPAIIATGLLLAGLTLLVSKMKKKRDEPEAVSELRKVDLLVDDDQSDIFSFEAALSPSNSSDALSPATSESVETEDKKSTILVEIDSDAKSPGGRSLLSFFTGVLGDNKANNEDTKMRKLSNAKTPRSRPIITPSNRLSPLLYAFSDDEEEDLFSSSESGTFASESMQGSPSPRQPYDSITLDELLVEKYSSNGDIDMVSPIHGISSHPQTKKNNQSLEVHTNQDQRSIIAARSTSRVDSNPIYAQSPKRPSPLVSPKPPLYKPPPNSKAPAATAAASPHKVVTVNQIFQGCPDIWSNMTSPRSPFKPNNNSTSSEICCPDQKTSETENASAENNAQREQSHHENSTGDTEPGNVITSVVGSPSKADEEIFKNDALGRAKRSASSMSPTRRSDINFGSSDVPPRPKRATRSISPDHYEAEYRHSTKDIRFENKDANIAPANSGDDDSVSVAAQPQRNRTNIIVPPEHADYYPAADDVHNKGTPVNSPFTRADYNPAANNEMKRQTSSVSPPRRVEYNAATATNEPKRRTASMSPPKYVNSHLSSNEISRKNIRYVRSMSPPKRMNKYHAVYDAPRLTKTSMIRMSPSKRHEHYNALTEAPHQGKIRNGRSASPRTRKPTSAPGQTTPRHVRTVKSMSPPKQSATKDSPEKKSVATWGRKNLSSPRKTKSPGFEGDNRQGPVISTDTSFGKRLAPKNRTVAESANDHTNRTDYSQYLDGHRRNLKKIPQYDQTDPWSDTSSSFSADPWKNDSFVEADPWAKKGVGKDVAYVQRKPRSTSPDYNRTVKTPSNESRNHSEFSHGGNNAVRSARSVSPPKQTVRSGKKPPAEIWNQPLFSQEKLSRDIVNNGDDTLQDGDLPSTPGETSGLYQTHDHEEQQISAEQDSILEQIATDQASKTCSFTPLEIKPQSPQEISGQNVTPQKWSFQSVVNAAAKAAASVRLSFGDSKMDHSPFVDDDSSEGSRDNTVLLRHVPPPEPRTRSDAYSPETAYIAANNKLRKTATARPSDHSRSSSPSWLSRARAGLRRSSPRKSTRSPVHDRATQGQVPVKRMRKSHEDAELNQAAYDGLHSNSPRGRRHARYSAVDGSTDYQAMLQNRDPNMSSFDAVSLSDSAGSSPMDSTTPRSFNRNYYAGSPTSDDDSALDSRDGQKLLMDLVWLEKKIASQKPAGIQRPSSPFSYDSSSFATGLSEPSNAHRSLTQLDSMSFTSLDGNVESETEASSIDPRSDGNGMSSIICRDCYAPPGRLRIVIHSTKDGPSVHTVKQGSSLEGHVFPGDLIVSVDDTDTRAFTAEQVMRMMAARENQERKITVLHFEEEDKSGVKRQRKS